MGEPFVWRAVLFDIMEVLPLRALRHALTSMSSVELMRKAILLTRLDALWSQDFVIPAKMESHSLAPDVCRVEIILGGDFILTLFKEGALQLHDTQHLSTVLVEVSRPDHPERLYHSDSTDMRRSCSSRGENWTVVIDCYSMAE